MLLLGDALVGKQGRAEDLLLALQYAPTPHFTLKARYRVLEGVVDNEKVYNFTWLNYLLLGGVITF